MNEQEWLTSEDPNAMFDLIQAEASERELQLFGVACCRRVFSWSTSLTLTVAIDAQERFADGWGASDELLRLRQAARRIGYPAGPAHYEPLARLARAVSLLPRYYDDMYCDQIREVARETCDGEGGKADIASLLRDIFGNPYRSVAVEPAWLTSDVLLLARGIYAEKAFDRMPILADALQDAGCDNPDVLNHCRGDGPHVRGCWVVDLVLGKA